MGMEMKDKIAQFIVWFLLPYHVRYWVVIRAVADATQGEWSDQEVPALKAMDVLARMK